MSRGRSGIALLEVVAAIIIFSIAVVTAIAMSADAARVVQQTRDLEREVRAASAFLDAVALWPREDFDRRLGVRRQGAWRMYVERPSRTLYAVMLRDTVYGTVLLSTSFYRPADSDAHP